MSKILKMKSKTALTIILLAALLSLVGAQDDSLPDSIQDLFDKFEEQGG
jgi:hypothetical protein